MLPFLLVPVGAGAAQSSSQFPEASETEPQLIELWTRSDSGCRLAMREDVKVVVACLSRSVYGAALNERNWCMGRKGQANAAMTWHECQQDSIRFPPFNVPKI